MQIIGVVKDYHQQSLNKDFTPILFALHEKLSWMKQRYISVVMENGNPRDLVKQVEGVWERYFPDSSYDYFFLDQFFDQQYRQDEVFGLIVALFAILAIFISCMGLAVLVMFSCSTRIREMGIRKVLGASRRQLFFELGREFFLLIAIAVVIALPLSGWIMGDWLNHYSFRTDWKAWFFLVPVVLLCVISLLTIGCKPPKPSLANRPGLCVTNKIQMYAICSSDGDSVHLIYYYIKDNCIKVALLWGRGQNLQRLFDRFR